MPNLVLGELPDLGLLFFFVVVFLLGEQNGAGSDSSGASGCHDDLEIVTL